MTNKKHIVLIGFSGSGKSTIGPLLSDRLRVSFVDADQLIERQAGCTISEIFKRGGEKTFRRMEQETIESVLNRHRRAVIGLGGGAFEKASIRKLAFDKALVVYLSCGRREIYRRLRGKWDRPLLNVRPKTGQTMRQARLARIGCLLDRRLTNYRRADLIFSTTARSPRQTATRLQNLIGK